MFRDARVGWFKKLSRKSKKGKPNPRKRSRWLQLSLELLEDRTLLATWTAIGPAPIVSGQIAGGGPVSGRITGIAPDKTDPNTIFIATAGGGVWKTSDGGTTWAPLTDNLTSGGRPLPLFMGA